MSASIDVSSLLGAAWRRVGIPLLGLCAGLIAAQGVTQLLPPRYETQASVLVTASSNNDDRPADLALAQNLTPTIARLVGSREVALDTARALNLPEQAVLGHVRGEFEPGLQIITVHATAGSGAQAAAISNAASRAVSEELGRLDMGSPATISARVLDTASPPVRPAFPKPLLNGVLGALAGLLAGWGASILRDRFDNRLRDTAQIEARLGLPVVGALPPLPHRFARHHAAALYGRPDVRDAIRTTISTLSVLTAPLPRRRLLVTSAHDDDGKALVTALLGLGMADEQCRATLVDGAVRDPLLSGHFPDAPYTWQQVLAAQTTPGRLPDLPTLAVLPAEPRNGAGTKDLDALGGLLTALGENEDCVIVHAPPILGGREIAAFAQHVDGVLLVVRAGRTSLRDSTQAARLIRQLGLALSGVVVIGADDRQRSGAPSGSTTDAAPELPAFPVPRSTTQGAVIRELVNALAEDSSSTAGRHRRQDPDPTAPVPHPAVEPEPAATATTPEAPIGDAVTESTPLTVTPTARPNPQPQHPLPPVEAPPTRPAPVVDGMLSRPLAWPEPPSLPPLAGPPRSEPRSHLVVGWPTRGEDPYGSGRAAVAERVASRPASRSTGVPVTRVAAPDDGWDRPSGYIRH